MSGVVAIICARMGSSRLPGKVLKPLPGGSVLSVIVDRVAAARTVDRVVVATTLRKADDPIVNFCRARNIHCYKGSENDVLDRVYQAAVEHGAEIIVDITADCPLVDGRHIDRIVRELRGEHDTFAEAGDFRGYPDYVSNCWQREWPDGLDIQAYTFAALKAVWDSPDSVREHVGWNIAQQAESLGFYLRQVCAPRKYAHPEWGLTLDEAADYELIKKLFTEGVLAGGDHLFPVEYVLDYLLSHPEMLDINAGVRRHVNSNNRAAQFIEDTR